MIKSRCFVFAAIVVSLATAARSAAQSLNFVPIDVPCGACPGGIARQTIAEGINPGGEIVGTYKDAVNAQHGFLLSGGRFTAIDVPGAVATIAAGINPAGDIVGRYTASVGSSAECAAAGSPSCIHGFLYSHGKFSTITFPGHPGAFAQRITPTGDIYGCLHDFDLMGSMFGAVWTRFGDTSLASGGGELAPSSLVQSLPASMNNGGNPDGSMIVGHYTDMMTNLVHGFLVQNGDFRPFDFPNSTFTQIWDVNPKKEFVGTYKDASNKQHGFLKLPNASAPTGFDYPGAAATIAFGVNPGGAIVGQYTASGNTHGFLAVPPEE